MNTKKKKSKIYNEIKKIEKEITETKTEHNLLNITQRKKHNKKLIKNNKKLIIERKKILK